MVFSSQFQAESRELGLLKFQPYLRQICSDFLQITSEYYLNLQMHFHHSFQSLRRPTREQTRYCSQVEEVNLIQLLAKSLGG